MHDDPTTQPPGTGLLADRLDTDDPDALLLQRHPPGTPLHRLAIAMLATAADLDTRFTAARQAGAELRRLRREDEVQSAEVHETARRLELALHASEILDLCLIRLLGGYSAAVPGNLSDGTR